MLPPDRRVEGGSEPVVVAHAPTLCVSTAREKRLGSGGVAFYDGRMSGRTVLVLGGTGFVSGTVARAAVEAGETVWIITRGSKPAPAGVTALAADRHDRDAFSRAVDEAVAGAGGRIDLVVDVIAFTPEDARQDLEALAGRVGRLVLVSTDFVYDPHRRRFPQSESDADYLCSGYGGQKREAERVLEAAGTEAAPWVVVRPGHIYGPGSLLGCLPPVGRDADLIGRIRRGEAVELVGAGHYLQQPVFAPDLARVILELGGAQGAKASDPDERVAPSGAVLGFVSPVGQILNVAGPDIVESVDYYRFVAEALGTELRVTEVPVEAYRAEHPERETFLCHRFYDLGMLEATGVRPPDTPLRDGIARHVESLLGGS
jgi:nucleoside-diphosphate-sugar epimerase